MEHCKHGKTQLVYCPECHVEKLENENQKLRFALEDIAENPNATADYGHAQQIAKAALEANTRNK